MAPKPTMSELRADAAADAKMEGAVEAQTEAQLMQSYPKAKPGMPAGTILRDAMDAVKSTIAAGTRPLSPRAAPPGSSKDVDAMSDGSFEKVEDDVVMVTEADTSQRKLPPSTRMRRTLRLWNWLARLPDHRGLHLFVGDLPPGCAEVFGGFGRGHCQAVH